MAETEKEVLDVTEDLEICSKEGRHPRCARRYRIRIDGRHHIVRITYMTWQQLLELAGKCNPDEWNLYQKMSCGELKKIEPGETVDFTVPGIERFITIKCKQREGEATTPPSKTLRRQFDLPEHDVEFLDQRGLPWETICYGNDRWLTLKGFPIPVGFNVLKTEIALKIEAAYPDTQIDMAYFRDPLSRADGRPIRQLSTTAVAGDTFQRWSRHRLNANEWRVGIDDVSTHLEFVTSFLEQELAK